MKSQAFLTLIFLVNTVTSENYACPEYGVAFMYNDVASVLTDDWQTCGEVCSLVSNCEYWSYNEGSNRICYLKSSDDGLEKNNAIISGAKGCP